MAGDKEVKVPGQPTANEAMFFYHILVNMKAKPDIDWEAVAAAQGLKSAEVAKVRFGQVKRKLGVKDPGSAKKPASSASSPTTGAATGPKTPSKVKKPTGRVGGKKAAVKVEAAAGIKMPNFLNADDEDDDGAVKKDDGVVKEEDDEGPKTPKPEPATFDEWVAEMGN